MIVFLDLLSEIRKMFVIYSLTKKISVMGWFGRIIIGILAVIVIAVFLDILTVVYEYAWIIPIVIVLFILWRKLFFIKRIRIKRLLKSAMVDDAITDKEKQAVIKKAMKSGLSKEEAEIYTEEMIYKLKRKR